MSEKLKKKKKEWQNQQDMYGWFGESSKKKKIAEFKHHIKELKIELTWIQKSLQEG